MRRLAPLLLALLLGACAGPVTEPQHYLLRGDIAMDSRPLQPATGYGLGAVSVAPYIDQQGLLLETTDGEIRPARHHLWAEPVVEGVRIFLLQQISHDSGVDLIPLAADSDAALINVRIDQMHGTADGEAVLVAYWWLSRDGEAVSGYKFAETRGLDASGYSALAQALRGLLADLAGEIAGSLDAG